MQTQCLRAEIFCLLALVLRDLGYIFLPPFKLDFEPFFVVPTREPLQRKLDLRETRFRVISWTLGGCIRSIQNM